MQQKRAIFLYGKQSILKKRKMTKFIALVSGKGGVGKTTATVNVGQALSNLGKKVILLDANLVTPNVAIQLGYMDPENTVNQFLRKEKSVKDIMYLHHSGLSIIPASPSYREFQKTNVQKIDKIFSHLTDAADFVLVDAPSGLGYEVSQVIKHCDEALIVVNPNLSSVMDALKTIKLAKAHNTLVAGILVNMSHGGRHELAHAEVESILGLPILGNVPHTRKVRKSVNKQLPLNHLYPRSKAAKEFSKVATHFSLEHQI